MYQLFLISSISQDMYVQTIRTLKELTGMVSGQKISTFNLITKPHQSLDLDFNPGSSQIEQNMMKCTTVWKKKPGMSLLSSEDEKHFSDDIFNEKKNFEWTFQIIIIPFSSKNQQCFSQSIYETTLTYYYSKKQFMKDETKTDDIDKLENFTNDNVSSNDNKSNSELNSLGSNKYEKCNKKNSNEKIESFKGFLYGLGFNVINQYWLNGIRFFYNDIVIEIFRVYVKVKNQSLFLNEKTQIKLLDATNSFQIKAYINISKSTDVDLINKGLKDLAEFKDFIKDLIDFDISNIEYVDYRIKL